MKKVIATKTWTLVTNTTAMLQFGEKCTMVLGGSTKPTDKEGFVMGLHEKYINNGLVNVWVRGHDNNGVVVTVCEISE